MKLLLMIILTGFSASTEINSHDPGMFSTVIFESHGEWNMKMTFATKGLTDAMEVFYENEDLSIASNDFQLMLAEYLQYHSKIRINKHLDVALTNFTSVVTGHAIEVNFKLKMEAIPQFWDIDISACEENKRGYNLLRVIVNGQSNLFKTNVPHTKLSLISNREGSLSRLAVN